MKTNGITLALNAKISKFPTPLQSASRGTSQTPLQPSTSSGSAKPPSKATYKVASIFNDDEDDEDEAPKDDGAFSAIARVNAKLYGTTAKPSTIPTAKSVQGVDPNIYDYDAAYDAMAAQREAEKARKEAARSSVAAKYITDMKAYSDLRKREQQIIKEQMMIKEREREDAQFSNTVRIVTGAYKRKLEEDAKVLAEVAARDGETPDKDASLRSARETAQKSLVTGMSIVNTKGTLLLGAVKGVYGASGQENTEEILDTEAKTERQLQKVVTLSSVLGDDIVDDSHDKMDDGDHASRAQRAKERYLLRKRQKITE